MGANITILLDLYNKHVRSILEYAAPAWSPMITTENCEEIERVQKSAYFVIFGPMSYEKTLKLSNSLTLEQRRVELCNKFAKKCSTSPVFTNWFNKKENVVNTRNPKTYTEVQARCNRWMNSPIPHMTKLLNNQ